VIVESPILKKLCTDIFELTGRLVGCLRDDDDEVLQRITEIMDGLDERLER
jgi:hypothetical protein